MGRDLRQIGCNRNNYPDKCYLYDSSAIKGNKLVQGSKPLCRFYKRDVKPFQWQRPTINGIASGRTEFMGTIETVDHVEKMKPDMYVVDQTGMIFIVVEPVISDDANSSKVIGTRPTVKTIATLKGLQNRD